MQFDHLPTFKIQKGFNGRSERLQPFVERINASRKTAGYKPYPFVFVSAKMNHIETVDLDAFYKKLDSSKNFCALWHYYCTNPKKK